MKNRQIEKVDNRKIKITYDLMIWSMATPCWSWNKILDPVGTGKKQSSLSRSHGWIKITLQRKTRQISLINENSIVGPQINNEMTA